MKEMLHTGTGADRIQAVVLGNPSGVEINPTRSLTPNEIQPLSLAQRIEEIHINMEPQLEKSGIRIFSKSGNPEDLEPGVRESAEKQRERLDRLNRRVNSDKAKEALSKRELKLIEADSEMKGKTPQERLQARMSKFPNGVVYVFDMDNTITDHSQQVKEMDGLVDPHLLGSKVLDPHIGENREYFPEAYAAGWQQLVKEHPKTFADGGRMATMREGMPDLLDKLSSKENNRVTVLSSNFRPFVDVVMGKIPGSEKFRVLSLNEKSVVPTSKGDMLKHIALQNPDKALVYVGDGGSDIPTLEASGVVAGYFALEGSSFKQSLDKRGLVNFGYKKGQDIEGIMFIKPNKENPDLKKENWQTSKEIPIFLQYAA